MTEADNFDDRAGEGAVVSGEAWYDDAAVGSARSLPCLTRDPEMWFSHAPDDVERAKELCGDCPAKAVCLEGARQRGEECGVWGGEILEMGRVVAHKRPRGRPRKDAA